MAIIEGIPLEWNSTDSGRGIKANDRLHDLVEPHINLDLFDQLNPPPKNTKIPTFVNIMDPEHIDAGLGDSEGRLDYNHGSKTYEIVLADRWNQFRAGLGAMLIATTIGHGNIPLRSLIALEYARLTQESILHQLAFFSAKTGVQLDPNQTQMELRVGPARSQVLGTMALTSLFGTTALCALAGVAPEYMDAYLNTVQGVGTEQDRAMYYQAMFLILGAAALGIWAGINQFHPNKRVARQAEKDKWETPLPQAMRLTDDFKI